MVGFFGFPFSGNDECNKCKASFCGLGNCGFDNGCGCKKHNDWWNWLNKGRENDCCENSCCN